MDLRVRISFLQASPLILCKDKASKIQISHIEHPEYTASLARIEIFFSVYSLSMILSALGKALQ
jgi:hypothetical protein